MGPPRTREKLLTASTGELIGCWLGVRCSGCTKSVYIPLKLMAAKHGSKRTLRDVLERLRCGHCRSGPSVAWVVDYPTENCDYGGQVATWHVDLLP